MSFNGAKDGKHYWLTPEDLMEEIKAEFEIDFDPCPYPKPENFDGLTAEWGSSNYVNPPFGVIEYEEINKKGQKVIKKKGATAWARKCIEEFKKGKRVVMVYPIDKWVLMLLDAGAKVRNLYDVKWEAIEDRNSHQGTGRHIAMFILEPPRLPTQRAPDAGESAPSKPLSTLEVDPNLENDATPAPAQVA